MIPGAYHTGICYIQTPDGRKGWAELFNDHGFNVLVTDLPGTGRSGFIPFKEMDSNYIVDSYVDLINSIQGKIVLLTHSLSGPIGFKLVERLPEKISHLISIEPGLLGNVQEVSIPISESDELVKIKFKGFDFELNMKEMSEPSQQLVDRLSKTCTKHFPADQSSLDQYVASLQTVHPRLMYERFNIKGSQLKIDNYDALRNCNFLIITGTEDPVHKDEDYKIVNNFKENNIEVDHFKLNEKDINGNGHMMMVEENNQQILNLIIDWIDSK